MTKEVHVVVMFDANSHSGQAENRYQHIRNSINRAGWENEDEAHPLKQGMETLLEMAQEEFPEMDFIVEQWDTAQLYHEKNGHNFLLPQLAKGFVGEGNRANDIGRDVLSRNLRAGHYHVLPPLYGEEEYYDAVATFLQALPIQDSERETLSGWNDMDVIEKAKTLQPLYLAYMNPIPPRYRGGEYLKAFKAYHTVRFNAGEATVENFLKEFEPDSNARTAFVFVSLDREALKRVHEARRGRDDKGSFMVFAVKPNQFLSMVRQLKRDMQQEATQEKASASHETRWADTVAPREGHGTIYPRKLMDFVDRGKAGQAMLR